MPSDTSRSHCGSNWENMSARMVPFVPQVGKGRCHLTVYSIHFLLLCSSPYLSFVAGGRRRANFSIIHALINYELLVALLTLKEVAIA